MTSGRAPADRASRFEEQKRGWQILKSLHPSPLDLSRTALLRDAPLSVLRDPFELEKLLLALGLNDEAIEELPRALWPSCGRGLRTWQFPVQFAPYLIHLSRLNIRSYLEVGIRHGGSFVATTEYLARFHDLRFAVGVDVIPCPAMAAYQAMNPRAEFWCLNTRSPAFSQRLDEQGPLDLVFIDSHHEEEQCRAELELFRSRAQIVGFHDITNVGCPGVQKVWQEVKALPDLDCFEYTAQYDERGPFMGIGLAIRKDRPSGGQHP